MPQTVCEFFEKDHREIDALLAAVDYAKPREACEPFREFRARLERHIRWEESLLFPAAAAKAPQLEPGPIRVMLMEHEQIRASTKATLEALEKGDSGAARLAAQALLVALGGHNSKEERILYPACDDLLSESETEALLSRARAVPPPAGR